MHIVHLTASTCFGGPERQMLGLAEALPRDFATSFIGFAEGGRGDAMAQVVRGRGFDGMVLRADTPHLRTAVRELATTLRVNDAELLLCHGYKANILGRLAARRIGIPVVAVSRGWTWESLKVRAYETLDRLNLRLMDRVVAVSEEQARRVRRAGVPDARLTVIRNAARLGAFDGTPTEPSRRILAAGRLSPEKGFDILVEAAARVLPRFPDAHIVLHGEGPERPKLEARLAELGLRARFAMPGFTKELDKLLPHAAMLVLPSYTEGLPNVVLEAGAAGVPVVATAVGGTPEVVVDGETGFLVPAGDPAALADRIGVLLADEARRRAMGRAARRHMEAAFTFAAQASAYAKLFATFRPAARKAA